MSQEDGKQLASQRCQRLLEGDSLAASIVLLVGLTGLQRFVGLVRNVLFCGLLTDDQLGRWSLSYNFLLLAAPLIVLGLPGSFGRYVEHYRQRGQLRPFLRRTTWISLSCTLAAAVLLFGLPLGVAVMLYDDPAQMQTARLLSVVLVTVVSFNFLIELLTALRLVRMVAVMQLVCSLVFAAVGLGLLQWTAWREQAVMAAFGVASLLASIVGLAIVIRLYRALPQQEPKLGRADLWQKLLPFAGWIWLTNLVANLFAVSDQFMLKHFSGLSPIAADSLVGQYYCSRVVPLLFVGVAAMIAGSLLPHLIKDWEAGRFAVVRRRIRTSIKLSAVIFTSGGAVVLVAAPLLFGWLLKGKYDDGLTVMPGALIYCIWFSLFCVGYNYLQCVEKARWGSAALATGLVSNVLLNYWLAPLWGLPGVVCATGIANLGAFGALLAFSRGAAMRWDAGVGVATVLPLALCLGGWAALIIVVMVCLAGWVFDVHERRQAADVLALLRQRLARRTDPREPQSA